ncbi:alpha/beta hydrolase-fold protein [Marinicella sp. S1101]|uniref:alpha/beta hydrolase n=1 Tax=Marinicella marina TaxID=2996016 RepID=UPI002260F409|nr:alpha/beta hydrolase-fold protein [Marinicella marina]MCX7553842.1 alpha/beta hydrolase-fold protein [Marinicella marina]MDJ1140918.1 alpha/beta hydrolase-fold protein [Marinicella marina]
MSIHNQNNDLPRGCIQQLEITSECLKGNPLGDPHVRQVPVYLPHAYDACDADENGSYPVMYYLAAYTNSGQGVVEWRAFGESIPERLDRMIHEQKMGPTVVVFPECFTRLGGNQYLDSPAMGAYASHIHDELIPLVESTYAVKKGASHRAVLGKSSGGFAAIRFAMDFPGQWGAIANHSGDAGFDLLYQRDFPAVADILAQFNGDIEKFIKRFWKAKKVMGSHILAMMHLCMAATYDGEDANDVKLPFDLDTCELDAVRWQKWLAHDPVNRVTQSVTALQQLNGLYMDCGFRDQYYIHYGMRQLSKKLEKAQIEHTYTEFNGTHSGIDYRLDESLPYLYEKIK